LLGLLETRVLFDSPALLLMMFRVDKSEFGPEGKANEEDYQNDDNRFWCKHKRIILEITVVQSEVCHSPFSVIHPADGKVS
jgi:hypothetical protein